MTPTFPRHDREIAEMFDRIAPRYDRLNRILSFGADVSWRRRAIELARMGPRERGLDVGAGTGDLTIGLLHVSDPSSAAIALDLAPRMLAIAGRRIAAAGLSRRALAAVGNAETPPLADASIDRVISAFTLRNIGDLPRALREMRRVLRPGGRIVLLELSHPPGAAFGALYRWYFGAVAPRVAALLGGDALAYRYLPRSLRAFPRAEALARMVADAGLVDVRFERLSLGIAAIHTARSPGADPLAGASEVVVLLGGVRTARVRAEAAAALARERPGAVVIVSGRRGFGPGSGPTEAELMAALLREEGISRERILLEDESRDTIGNALLTAARYLRGAAPRPLTVVTSPFHLERALFIFRAVIGPAWPVQGHAGAALPGDEDGAADEARYLDDVRRMLDGVAPGDLAAVAARLRERWPDEYGGVARLDPARLR